MDFVKLNVQGSVANIEISKEKSLNALNRQVLTELSKAIDEIKTSSTVRVVTLTGAGEKAFVAGADISEMKDLSKTEAEEFALLGQKVFSSFESLDQVVIAMVNGFALGGGFELALSCDVLFATKNAKFGLPEVGLGLIPGFGGTQRLSRSLGLHMAKTLTLSAEMVDADKMKALGLVFEVFQTKEEMVAAALKFASKVSSKGTQAVASAKAVIEKGFDLDMKAALKAEADSFSKLFQEAEANEGISAFLEKRKPSFT